MSWHRGRRRRVRAADTAGASSRRPCATSPSVVTFTTPPARLGSNSRPERGAARQDDACERHAVVRLLERVDQRTAPQRDLALGLKHLRDARPAAARPSAATARRCRRSSIAGESRHSLARPAAHAGAPFTRIDGIRRPARQPDVQRELARRVGLRRRSSRRRPRVVRRLPQRHLAGVRAASSPRSR